MAVKKICGIETEYGIIHTGKHASPDNDIGPIVASSMLINSYVATAMEGSPSWNFEHESPGLDARGFMAAIQLNPDLEAQFMNAVLTNGARYYVDHAHPEYSSPECSDAKSALIYDRAGEEILKLSMKKTLEETGEEIIVYKNNSDGKRNSYGCHENYLISRKTPFLSIVQGATAHFITRQIFTGAGKVGTELPNETGEQPTFQISQRADFIEEEVGLETTLKRPIINTRDEPHSYADKYRRFHVIVGDANISQTATFLKLGTTAIVLSMIEDDFFSNEFIFSNPVHTLRQVSCDLDLTTPLELKDSGTITALEVQWEILNHAQKYAESEGLETVDEKVGNEVLELWEEVLNGLEKNPDTLSHKIDWIAKKKLIDGYCQRHNLAKENLLENNPHLKAIDLQYHDLRDSHCLASRLGLEEIITVDEVEQAITEPPESTRAYFRGMCLKRFPKDIVAINWDSIVFKQKDEKLKRVSMMEPEKGTKALTEELFENNTALEEFLDAFN